MKLNLKNPIVFLDLETTGINVVTDRIVEIALLKIFPDGHEEEKLQRINPGIPIPPQSSAIHGIYDEDVKDAPLFKEVAKNYARFIEGCDLAGFNSTRFDIPLLSEEFLRVDIDLDMKKHKFVDVQIIFHRMEKRTLAAAYKFYLMQDLENAHNAMSDTIATKLLLLLHRPPAVTSANVIAWSTQTDVVPVITAGNGFTVTVTDDDPPPG